ncbi:MAG: DNA repair protein RadC [Gammaproteobacteria bacterium]|nr:DNA repair protein RadC [Gammaproteobacteria bacterium]
MAISDWPKKERPRERLVSCGAGNLSDAELLAICLRSGIRGKSALDLARDLLLKLGSLNSLFESDLNELCQHEGIGPEKYALLQAAAELSRRQMFEKLQTTDILSSSDSTRAYLRARFRSFKHEVFSCIFLNNQHHIVKLEELFTGTIDGAAVYPREVVKRCLYHNAAAVIFAHNHPSGVAEPSQADISITRKLKSALETIDVRVLDHFVVGDPDVVSFAERGLL